MTREQVKDFLSELDYDTNQRLLLDEVSSIYVVMDHVIYPGQGNIFEFYAPDGDSEINLLLVYSGKYNKETSEFEYYQEEPLYSIPFSVIAGFTMVNSQHPKEPFKFGLAV